MKSKIRNWLFALGALCVAGVAGIVIAVLAGTPAAAAEPHGDWRVVSLDDRTIALTGDYSGFIRECYEAEKSGMLREWLRKSVPGRSSSLTASR